MEGEERDDWVPGAGGAAGAPFGPYRILREVGRGAMGIVYEALHVPLERRVALKMLSPDGEMDAEQLERFGREAKSAAEVAHDHVVPVYDAGRIEGIPYFTMPLMEGGSLEDVLRQVAAAGEAPPGRAAGEVLDRCGFPPPPEPHGAPGVLYARRMAAALAGVAGALHAIHGRGMFHRDVKPSNLLIGPGGRLLLADFGLVRRAGSSLTRAGGALGTPHYMSPEQLGPDPEAVDGRADVYALGAVLFQTLALRPPHVAHDLRSLIERKRSEPTPSLRDVSTEFPEDFVAVARRALASEVGERYASAALLAEDLRSLAAGLPVRARPLHPIARLARKARRRWLPLTVAAAALMVAGGWWWLTPGTLSVRTHPEARVSVDGEDRGVSPLAGVRLTAGAHHLRIETEGYRPLDLTVEVSRGGTHEVERVLVPLRPDDRESHARLARSLGIEVAALDVERTRQGARAPPAQVLFPRGRCLGIPRSVVAWAEEPIEGFLLELSRLEAPPATLGSWDLALDLGEAERPIPADLAGRIDRGVAYRIRVLDEDRREVGTTEFTVVPEAEEGRIRSDLAARLGSVPPEHPALGLLQAELLLGGGFDGDAYRLALEAGGEAHPGAPALRLRLLALEHAGLEKRGPWRVLVSAFLGPGDPN